MTSKKSDFDIRDLTEREKLSKVVAERIAKELPPEFVSLCIEESIRTYITNFKVEEYMIREAMKEAILTRTKELLKTKYQAQVEAEADRLAQQALAGTRR